ncbi:MAG: D-tyrosyl-tRNA(Tyr) deacylase [Acidimicrobiia bacterium]|nr:D-tyrosyl-tRNA(Tyr) deacylase [Acidimicrobiia bacterium]
MRAVVQRVSHARVEVAGEVVGSIESGLMILLGVAPTDTEVDAATLAGKLAGLRIFRDEQEKMNLSVVDVGGQALVISQFTLYGDTKKGRRPSFVGAAPPEIAEPLVESTVAGLEAAGVPTATGRFGADMAVSLTNDGPVTIVLEVQGGKFL